MTAPERRGPERPGPDYPPEWDDEPTEANPPRPRRERARGSDPVRAGFPPRT